MDLIQFAIEELILCGGFDETSENEYHISISKDVLELLEVFESQGHSGHSAITVLNLFNKLANYKPLTPVRKEDFIDVTMPGDSNRIFQCRRDSELFLTADGNSYYNINKVNNILKFGC
jgi:hypothetical protein